MADTLPGDSRDLPAGYVPPQSANELRIRYAAGERIFPDADIPDKSSLRGTVLAGAIFKDAWLSDVDFREADLRGCRFENCNVKCSDFERADLRNAAFVGFTHVEATSWRDANVAGADFTGAGAYGSLINSPEFPFGRFGGSCP